MFLMSSLIKSLLSLLLLFDYFSTMIMQFNSNIFDKKKKKKEEIKNGRQINMKK